VTPAPRSKTPAIVLLSFGAVCAAFTLLSAFAIYGELAALLAFVSLAGGAALISRRG